MKFDLSCAELKAALGIMAAHFAAVNLDLVVSKCFFATGLFNWRSPVILWVFFEP